MLVIVATLFLILRIPAMIVYQMIYFFSTLDMMNPTHYNFVCSLPNIYDSSVAESFYKFLHLFGFP